MSHRAQRQSSWFNWRVGAGSLFAVAIVVGFFLVLHWYAYSTYYLAPDHGVIGVYQGQPSGVLWFKPSTGGGNELLLRAIADALIRRR